MPAETKFRALVADHTGPAPSRDVRELDFDELGEADVLIRVDWSSVNYKDGLASIPDGRVGRLPQLIPGIDLVGTVVAAGSSGAEVGSKVIVHGYGLGVSHHGGFSEYARVPADWLVALPAGLTAREAMSLGTAGFTAALSVQRLEERGLQPGDGPVLVTGASGGVGSVAIGILGARGYQVIASTAKEFGTDRLRELGASAVLTREETSSVDKPLQRERWAAAIDCVGGSTLAYVLSTLRYGAAVAACGNTAGNDLPTTVLPFILRGVSLLGIDSVQCPIVERRAVWGRLAGELHPRGLADIVTAEITLDLLPRALDQVLAGAIQGRTLVRLN